MLKLAVIGAGSWGTAVASLAARNTETVMWARRPELAAAIGRSRENAEYLPGHYLPADLEVTADLGKALAGAGAVAIAVPSHGFRQVVMGMKQLEYAVPLVSLTKGIEQHTLLRMTQVVLEELPGHDPDQVGVLTGPNLAEEVASGHPAAAVLAMNDEATASALRSAFMGPTFRIYTNNDVAGCELAGALKNVMAIAAGMSDGLGFGDNTRAALITRALAELTRLGVALGGMTSTFAGLAGIGDLIATCTSTRSRNFRVGLELAADKPIEQIVGEMKMVAEGVKTTQAVLELAARATVEMPIATQVGRVLYEGVRPRDAVLELMAREPKAEA